MYMVLYMIWLVELFMECVLLCDAVYILDGVLHVLKPWNQIFKKPNENFNNHELFLRHCMYMYTSI